MENGAMMIIEAALELLRNDNGQLSAIDAIGMVSKDSAPADRAEARRLFDDASVRPGISMGIAFQESILERALRTAQRNLKNLGVAQQSTGIVGHKTPAGAGKEREKKMSDNQNTNTPSAPTAPKAKKYNVGDTFQTVSTMGLQPTDANRKATCGFQFSRKTGRPGVMDLPADTNVLYTGAKAVYEGQANSKRMFFRVTAGTRVLLDGAETMLDNDIEIAGVVNHIDADDPYNIQARQNEEKKAAKAQLKAAANAAKTKAA